MRTLRAKIPFLDVVRYVRRIYLVPREVLRTYHSKASCGLVREYRYKQLGERNWFVFAAVDLSHEERLVTIAHEFVHIFFFRAGIEVERHDEEEVDRIAEHLVEWYPRFMRRVYLELVTIRT